MGYSEKNSKSAKKSAYGKKRPKKSPKKGSNAVTKSYVKSAIYSAFKKTCEKKEFNTYAINQVVGQFQAISAGANPSASYFVTSALVSSSLVNGNTDITRIGDEIMVTGIRQVCQFTHQQNTSQSIRLKYYLYSPSVSSNTASFNIGAFLYSNPIVFNGNSSNPVLYDSLSSRNQDNMKNFIVHRTGSIVVPADQASLSQKVVKTVNLGLKFKKPWRVRFDSTGTLTEGQIFLLIVADCGNTSSNTPSLTQVNGIPITDTYSGLNLNTYSKVYFIDP